MQPTPSARRPRSDGLANRKRILHAASQAFAARGLDVPMDHVAREAKVGPATLYRHFPNRDALVEALLLELHARVKELIGAERDAGKSAWEIFTASLRIAAKIALDNHAFMQSLTTNDHGSSVLERLSAEFYRDLAEVAAEAQRDGDLRDDFAAGDLLLTVRGITVSGSVEDPERVQMLIDRQLCFLLDALRSPARTEAPVRGLSLEESVQALRLTT